MKTVFLTLVCSLLGLAASARADQSTIENLGTAIGVCNQTISDANSGSYTSYPSFAMDPILNDVYSSVQTALSTANSQAAISLMNSLLARIGKILNNDAANPQNSYSIPTTLGLFQSMKTSLSKVQLAEQSGVAPSVLGQN